MPLQMPYEDILTHPDDYYNTASYGEGFIQDPYQAPFLTVMKLVVALTDNDFHFYDPEESSSDDDESEADAPIQITHRKRGHTVRDATMKLWTFDDGDRSSTYLGQTSELDSTPTQ